MQSKTVCNNKLLPLVFFFGNSLWYQSFVNSLNLFQCVGTNYSNTLRMAKTRASKATSKATSGKEDQETTSAAKYCLPVESTNPPKVLILPINATPEARVVSLKNPRYGKPTRYLICPETGAYEFIKISAPKTTPRSWLFEASEPNQQDDEETASFQTQVTKGADLYLATPVDPLFLALPTLAAQFASTNKRMFLSSDDHIETIQEETPHLRETIVRWPKWRTTFEKRMAAGCDTVEAGDETMFRFSEDKLLAEMIGKAKRMTLPKSMEEKFVTKALEAPVLGVKRTNPVAVALKTEESTASTVASTDTEANESQESQTTVMSTATTISTAATSVAADEEESQEATAAAKEVVSAMSASEDILQLQRLRIAFNFICSSYLPPAMAAVLQKKLTEKTALVDFAPLDAYMAELTRLRHEALLSRSASDYSRKRNLDEEDDERREKRRKKEEEEKRKKAGESRGVRELKKVNTAGMMKLSAFFKPKSAS